MLSVVSTLVLAGDPQPAPPPRPVPSRAEPSHTEPTGAPARPTSQPEPRRPPRDGKGLMIAGGVIAGGALLGRAVLTGLAAASVPGCRRKEMSEDGTDDLECAIEGLGIVGMATTIPAAFGGGLLAGGAARRGKWEATNDLRAQARRHVRKRVALGWALLGGGLALYTATRFATFGCSGHGCEVALWEGGFWASAALVVPGLVIAPHATAYRRTRPGTRARHLAPTLSITPRASMIGITGRF